MVSVAGSILESRSKNSNSNKATKQVTVTLRTNLRIVTHITAKFASEVSHRRFCYINLARLTISRHLTKLQRSKNEHKVTIHDGFKYETGD